MGFSLQRAPRRGRAIRAAIAGVLLVVLLTLQNDLMALAPRRYEGLVRLAVLGVAVGLGTTVVRDLISAVFSRTDRQAAVMWRNLTSWTLYALLALLIASAVGVNLSGFLVGGAILGVIVATASQSSLGNFFAGLVLMFARPYQVGASIRVRGTIAGGVEFEGTVADMGALYTTLRTATGETLKLPNSGVVTSALVMGEAPLQAEVEVEISKFSLSDEMDAIRGRLRGAERISFAEVFAAAVSRLHAVVIFLALLELIRLGEAGFRQKSAFADIEILRGSALA